MMGGALTKWFAVVLLLLVSATDTLAEKRVALVIGNAEYANAAPLKNPVNDASDIADKLGSVGFEVIKAIDLDQTAMRRSVKQFADALAESDVALFYYAGHAVQVDGKNYLAPIDTDLQKLSDLDFETISLEFVQRQMEREARTSLIFLDACRNNPLTRQLLRRSRSVNAGQGLARLEPSGEGTFIAYATQPDNVALDGTGRNSPFAKALLQNIERPGVEISSLMTDVRRSVYEETNGEQLPWTNSSLLGHFFFRPQAAIADTAPDAASGRKKPGDEQRLLESLRQLEVHAGVWEAIKDSTDVEEILRVLKTLEGSPYASLARARLDLLADKPGKEEQQVASLPPETDPGLGASAPEETEPDRDLVRSIQKQLQRIGCDPGSADGIWGRKSRSALEAFSREAKIDLASLEPSRDLLDEVNRHEGRICPLVCGSGQVEKDGRCVARNPPAKPPSKSANAARRAKTVTRPATSSNCFRFNGQLVCE